MTLGRTLCGMTACRAALAVLILLTAAGCTGNTAGPPTASPPVEASPAPSPSPSTRPGKVGEPFDVDGWTITVTGQRCGPASEVVPDAQGMSWSDPKCVVTLTVANGTAAPADFPFRYLADRAAYGLDGAGGRFELDPYVAGPANPGTQRSEPLIFAVWPGLKLATVVVGGVAVPLT